jgi:hypothetical protein
MPVWGWIIVAAVVVAVLAVIGWITYSRNRTTRLRETFGPEYDRTVRADGSRSRAESELAERYRRRKQLDIRPLPPEVRQRYVEAWRKTQARFVDSPGEAVEQADALVTRVMGDRGYPMEDFEQRAADVSVDHPDLVENYRQAQARCMASREGKAGTEDLRQAFVHYRALFDELLETAEDEPRREAR